MVIQEEEPSLPIRWENGLKLRPKGRSIGLVLALGIATTFSAVLISDQATASPARFSQTALINSSSIVAVYPAVETAQISTDTDSSAWLYQGIVQISYAGVIAWVIALLQNSGK